MDDYYKILGISPIADEKEIRTAYRKLARQYHPDAGEGSSAENFREVQDAYDLLSDPEKRREYDRSREMTAPRVRRDSFNSVHIDLRDIFNSSPSRSTQNYAEPLIRRSGRPEAEGSFEDLVEYLLRRLRVFEP